MKRKHTMSKRYWAAALPPELKEARAAFEAKAKELEERCFLAPGILSSYSPAKYRPLAMARRALAVFMVQNFPQVSYPRLGGWMHLDHSAVIATVQAAGVRKGEQSEQGQLNPAAEAGAGEHPAAAGVSAQEPLAP